MPAPLAATRPTVSAELGLGSQAHRLILLFSSHECWVPAAFLRDQHVVDPLQAELRARGEALPPYDAQVTTGHQQHLRIIFTLGIAVQSCTAVLPASPPNCALREQGHVGRRARSGVTVSAASECRRGGRCPRRATSGTRWRPRRRGPNRHRGCSRTGAAASRAWVSLTM